MSDEKVKKGDLEKHVLNTWCLESAANKYKNPSKYKEKNA